MNKRLASLTLLALVVGLLFAPRAAAQEEAPLRIYKSNFLGSDNALMLALQVCGVDRDRCQVEKLGPVEFAVRAPAAVHTELSELLAARDRPPATQEFRLILLRAGHGAESPELPADAQRAVEDLQAVMPFSSFELIDGTLLRTSGRADTSFGEMGAFEASLGFEGDPREDPELLVDLEVTVRPVVDVAEALTDAAPIVIFGDRRQLIGSRFGIRVGETVVVGTSRIDGGDHAIVVLLTAVRRP